MSMIENKMMTVTLETQLIQLYAAYEATEIAFREACREPEGLSRDNKIEKSNLDQMHMREAATIAIAALFDLNRTRRAHFWSYKFGYEWFGDNGEISPEENVRNDEALSTEKDGNLMDDSPIIDRSGKNEFR